MHHRWTRRARACIAIVGIAAIASCKPGDAGPTDPGTKQTPTLAISVAPTSLDVNQGANATVTVTVTRGGGFADAVTLAVEGLPTGVTAPNVTVAAGATTGTLTFTAAASAVAALTNLTIRGTGTGVTASSALALTVKTVVTPTPAFSMAVNGASLSFAQGASATATVTITRSGGFTGAVDLTATGAPAGVTVSFSPASVASGSTTSTVTVASTAAAAAGSYTVTLHGAGTGGVAAQSATLSVQVTAAPGGSSGNTTWTFCGTSGLPLWVGAQDGAGAWSRVTGTNNAYSFNITSKGAIAYVVATAAGGFDLEVFYGTADELKQQGQDLCNGANTLGSTLSGTISGAAATDLVLIGLGRSVGTAASSNTTYSIPNVPSGSFDLIAGKSTFTLSGASVVFTPSKMFIKRNAPAGAAIDFGGADAFDPITKSLTVGNLNGEETRTVMTYITANTRGNFYVDAATSGGAARNYFGVPAARQAATDFHYLNIIATAAGSLSPTSTRNAGIAFNAATDKQVTLGPALSTPTISSLGSGRTRTVFTTQPEYARLFNADFQQVGAAPRRTSIQMTGGYSGAGTITIDVPDFTPVSGFDTNWLLKAGTSVTWTFIASGWQGSGVVSNAITDGATYLAATRMGTIGL